MSTPIYQIFIMKNSVAANQAWLALSEAERKALTEKDDASRKAVNAKVILACNSAWANEEYSAWGLLRFPDLAARIAHTRTLQEIGWFDRVEAFTLLGTSETEPVEVTIPNPIYKLWLIKTNPAAEIEMSKHSKEEIAAITAAAFEKHDAIYRETGSITMLQCSSYWCNEAYTNFGISVYPSIEANMKVMQVLEQAGWRMVVDVFTLLGTPM
jgi:hypothetical protein